MAQAAILEMPKEPAAKKKQPKKREHGTGSVYWRGKTLWIKYYVNGEAVRESAHTDKLSVATERLNEKTVDAGRGVVDTGKLTYEQMRDYLYADYKLHKHKSLFQRADGSVYLGPVPALDEFFKGCKAGRITTANLKDFVAARRKAGKSNSNINHSLRLLRRMFWLQVEENHYPSNLVPHFPLQAADKDRTDYLQPSEYEVVLKELHPDLKPLLIVGYHTGARRGELLKLKWASVNLDGGYMRLLDTKNGEDRTVPLIGAALPALQELRAAHPKAEYVFVRANGQPVRDFKKGWANALERAGLSGKHFHGLRRGAATNLMAAGVDQQTARKITGHRDRKTFEKYRQVENAPIMDAGKKLEAFLKGTKTGTATS